MTIYIDLVLFINFSFDLLLLIVVDIILKRKTKFRRLLLGSLFGSLTIFLLLVNINSFTLFLFKIITSIIMILITFSYKNIKYTLNNLLFLYLTSILLGGFLYYLNITFSYDQKGLVFFFKGFSINYLFLLIISPIILYIYIKSNLRLKTNYNYYYNIKITLSNGYIINTKAYLDTGNKLVEPLSLKPIIMIEAALIPKTLIKNIIYVPYQSINNNGLLNCIKARSIEVENIGIKNNIILGLKEDNFKIDDIHALLNNKIMEELKWLI